jgi:tetratricopeptide (TPR) repeat protein
VPPALLRNPGDHELLEGESILHEYPDDCGLLLWESYRDVRLWAGTPPELRGQLFHGTDSEQRREWIEGAHFDRETLQALDTLQRGLRRGGDSGPMVSAALSIAEYAERAGAASTAMAFTLLAAAAAPTASAAALAAGRLAVRQNHAALAEAWLRRTIALARRSRAWASYGGALIGLGQLAERRERLREAHAFYRMGVRLARRRGLSETQGQAVRGLLRIALREGDDVAAEGYANSALRLHRLEHPGRGSVLLDVAEARIRRGAHAGAARLLSEALSSPTETNERVRALTMLVRVAGATGDRVGVADAWHRAMDLIEAHGSTAMGARLLLGLARAGAEVMAEVQADLAAHRALRWAHRGGDAALCDECTAFLSRVRFAAGGGDSPPRQPNGRP